MTPAHLVAIDQGTTGSRVLCLDPEGEITGSGYVPHAQHYPRPGWVEHDPEEILVAVETAAAAALEEAGLQPAEIAGIGITNQRETVLLWDAHTGDPLDRAVVWQCRRTADQCGELRASGAEEWVRQRTGLVLDPYFSAAKIAWLLDQDPDRRRRAERGEILAGTIDSWLVWKLSGGAVHASDFTNASRTSLFSLDALDWDPELLDLFRVPRECLPRCVPSARPIATVQEGSLKGAPLTGIAGDQQAALFGHRCARTGQAKNTYGTGCFLLVHRGLEKPSLAGSGILTTVACGPRGEPAYAWEGSVFVAGAVVQWLRDELGILPTAAASEDLARTVEDSGGVVIVPAFTGLGAPYWDSSARGAVLGLTRGSGRAHLARAALESIALQTVDLVDAFGESGQSPALNALNVDGGATANSLLMQIQADLLGLPVLRAQRAETTALGAAYLAGIGAGLWPNIDSVPPGPAPDRFNPSLPELERSRQRERWRAAVAAVRTFGTGFAP